MHFSLVLVPPRKPVAVFLNLVVPRHSRFSLLIRQNIGAQHCTTSGDTLSLKSDIELQYLEHPRWGTTVAFLVFFVVFAFDPLSS